MPHANHAGIQSWEVALTLAIIVMALIYVQGWVRIRRVEPDTVGGWRVTSFLLGLFFIWLAVASPITLLDHELLTVHMVKHLLLMTIASPLVWLGAPMKPLANGLPRRLVKALIGPLFCSAPMKQLGRALANPTVCWLAAAGTLIGWHIPSLFILGMRSEMWHGIEQASFLLAGLLFWWPVVQPRQTVPNGSEWSVLLYLFLATLPCDILSGFLVFCDRVVYPVYCLSPRPFGFSALEDQQCAGALMWTCVTIVYLVAGAIVAARLLSPQSLRQHRVGPSSLLVRSASQATAQSMEVV